MKVRGIAVLCLLTAMSLPAWAQNEKIDGPGTAAPEADMAAMMKAMTPGDQHKQLSRMAGDWTFTNKMWMAPDAPPAESNGTMHAEMILGGRYVQSVWKGNMMGQPFEGRGTDGYDNLSQKHVSSWVDNMGTGIMYSTGTCDASGKVCTSTTAADMMDPMTGQMTSTRMVVTWKDDKNFGMEMYMKPAGGAETKSMEMTVTKK